MVIIKIHGVNIPEEEKYIGGIYEAFKMEREDGRIEYCTKVDKDRLIPIWPGDCEIIEEVPMTMDKTNKVLLVEDGSVDIDDLDEWCSNHSIKLVVYRNGANKPEFLTVKEI